MECLEYMSWALKGNHLRVYAVPTKSMYTYKKGTKTVNLSYVKLVIEIGNAKHLGKEEYKQHEMHIKVCEIYKHYYDNHKAKI
jgi:hypothetical protein